MATLRRRHRSGPWPNQRTRIPRSRLLPLSRHAPIARWSRTISWVGLITMKDWFGAAPRRAFARLARRIHDQVTEIVPEVRHYERLEVLRSLETLAEQRLPPRRASARPGHSGSPSRRCWRVWATP